MAKSEEKVVAFAEQVGRIVGTVQAKAERLTRRTTVAKKPAARAAKPVSKGRSGGLADAPGKKHRKPMPKDPRAVAAGSKRSSMQAGRASMKTMKTRGRG